MTVRSSAILTLVPMVMLVVTGIFSLLSQRSDQLSVPSSEEWKTAADYVKEHFKQGDIVRINPYWADQARIYFHGYPVDILSKPEEEVLYSYSRLWIVVGFGREDRARETLPPDYEELDSTSFGRVSVLLVNIPPSDYVRYDILNNIENAQVSRDYPDRVQPCQLMIDDQWHCGVQNQWLWVGARIMDPNDEPHRCLYVPAIEFNGIHRVVFPDVPLSANLEGRAGLDLASFRSERGSEVYFDVFIGEQHVYHYTYAVDERSYLPYRIDTSAMAGQRHNITYTVQAENFFDRYLCITGRVTDVHETAIPVSPDPGG